MLKCIDRFIRIALTEWRCILTDPVPMLIAVVGVTLYAFYYPVAYMPQLSEKAPVAIVDGDRSTMSREMIRMASSMQSDTVVAIYDNESDAQKAMADEEIYGYLKIPKGMESDLRKGLNVTLGAYCHGGFLLVYRNVATAFSTAAGTVGATVEVKRLVAAKRAGSLHQAMAIRDPLPVRFITMFNGAMGYGVYVVPAVLILVLQQTCLIAIGAMGGPRRNRRFKALKGREDQEGASVFARYFGRMMGFFFHYIVVMFLYKLFIYHFFKMPDRGDDFSILIFGLLFFWAVINLGMCAAQFFERRETGIPIFVCIPIFIIFSSGFSWPVQNMPAWIQVVGAFFPSTHAIPAWLALQNMGAELYEVSHYLIRLFGLGCFYMVLGLLLAKRRDLTKGQSANG